MGCILSNDHAEPHSGGTDIPTSHSVDQLDTKSCASTDEIAAHDIKTYEGSRKPANESDRQKALEDLSMLNKVQPPCTGHDFPSALNPLVSYISPCDHEFAMP